MSKPRDRLVLQRQDGTWQNKRNDASRPSTVHDAQREVQQATRRMLKNQGGGGTTLNTQGRIRSKDTIPPGNDPLPPKDKEH